MLYTYKAYSGQEIIDYIEKHPLSYFSQEIKRRYCIDYGFCFKYCFRPYRYYYINSYETYWCNEDRQRYYRKTYKLNKIITDATYEYYNKDNDWQEEIND